VDGWIGEPARLSEPRSLLAIASPSPFFPRSVSLSSSSRIHTTLAHTNVTLAAALSFSVSPARSRAPRSSPVLRLSRDPGPGRSSRGLEPSQPRRDGTRRSGSPLFSLGKSADASVAPCVFATPLIVGYLGFFPFDARSNERVQRIELVVNPAMCACIRTSTLSFSLSLSLSLSFSLSQSFRTI